MRHLISFVDDDTVRGNYVIPRDRCTKYWHYNIQYDQFLAEYNSCSVEIGPIPNETELQLGQDIQVYPNPSQGVVQLHSIIGHAFHYTVIDVLGQDRLQGESINGSSLEMRLPDTPGIYWIRYEEGLKNSYLKVVRE